jgi:hypothetical protein
MCARVEARVARNLWEAAIDLVWRQWRGIGAAATGEAVKQQVDPEALCLASLFFQDHEPRLWVAMTDWLRFGASLLSVQRVKNLAGQFPSIGKQLDALAHVAVREAKDARWASLLGSTRPGKAARAPIKQRAAGPALLAAPALMLRMRAAFSVGVKSDLLAFLLGQRLRVTVAVAATALGYRKPAVFRALQDLRAAALVHSAELPAAAEYWINSTDWYSPLGGESAIARWGYWREVLVYACAAFTLEHDRNYLRSSEYARATALRELASRHEAGLLRAGVIEQGVPRSAEFGEWRQFHDRLAQAISAAA